MEKDEKKWRERAEEYRVFAERAKDAQTRSTYITLAENCERIAEHKVKLAQRTRASAMT